MPVPAPRHAWDRALATLKRQWRRWQEQRWQHQCDRALRQLDNSTRRDLGLAEVDDSPRDRFY
jgi:hypothetical protein